MRHVAPGGMALAALAGLRFSAAALVYLLSPALVLYTLAAFCRARLIRRGLYLYMGVASLTMLFIWLADMIYFQEAGKHFTYEAFVYLNTQITPILAGTFKGEPFAVLGALAVCAGGAVSGAWASRALLGRSLRQGTRMSKAAWAGFAVLVLLFVIGGRGGLQHRRLAIGHSCISTNPCENAICLDPLFSVIISGEKLVSRPPRFKDEAKAVAAVRRLLGLETSSSQALKYPLVRQSPGSGKGNGKNVVIMILESWTARDLGCLGGDPRTTPVFDRLSSQGLLFTNFHANGIRTAEGIVSIMTAFPNQTMRPVIRYPNLPQTHLRTIPQILGEIGYNSIFIHGRDLWFDQMEDFLRMAGFKRIIDRDDFPGNLIQTRDGWPGYSDEEVFRKANEEFAKEKGPFLGAIYTMSTHPPFVIPPDFKAPFPKRGVENRFWNSLNYCDASLGIFFDLARKEAYFKNTIFILVADHTRTADDFNYGNQHHIPMLIYAPGLVEPGVKGEVGQQLDILPTVLGLLNLKTSHAAWGHDLLTSSTATNHAVSVCGADVRWRDSHHLLNFTEGSQAPQLFDLDKDPDCRQNLFGSQSQLGQELATKLRAHTGLSAQMLYQNRIYGEVK